MSADGSTLETARLILQRMTVDEMTGLFTAPYAPNLLANREFTNPYRVLIDDSGPLRFRVPLVQKDPSKMIWLMRWIINKADNVIVGYTSFHDSPDEDGMIEIGITIVEAYRGRGLAQEALVAMWEWAATRSEVKLFRYTVSPDNRPSVAIIRKFGFEHVGQQIDDVDGPEDIYEMEPARFMSRQGTIRRG